MKKILLIFNETHSPVTILTFIKKNINTDNILLHGLFIKRLHMDQVFTYAFPNDLNATAIDYTTESDADESLHLMKSYRRLFSDECEMLNLKHQSSFLPESSIKHIIEMSLFADLILTDSQTEFNDQSLHALLPKVHCPLLLVSPHINTIQNIILAYDGSYNSIYAIKNFSYFFPQWSHLPTQLVTATNEDEEHLSQAPLLKEWLTQHFSNATLQILHGKPKEEMVAFINQTENTLVVMGAFGRNAISRWANTSLAEVVFENTKATLFIAHQ